MKMNICNNCDETFPPAEIVKALDGSDICSACVNNITEMAVNIKIFEFGNKYEFIWTEYFGFQLLSDMSQVKDIPAIDSFVKYSSTEYVPKVKDGFITALSNWIFDYGNPDKTVGITFIKKLSSKEIVPPIPLVVIMQQLGGLKMSVDIIIRSSDVSNYSDWEKTLRLN